MRSRAGRWLLGIFLALVVIFVLGALLLPARMHAESVRTLNAPAEKLYPLLVNLRDGWPLWSPFGKNHDPKLVETFSGPPSGAGAKESWSGGGMQPGSIEIVSADPGRVKVHIELQGGVVIDADIVLKAEGPQRTQVRWADDVQPGTALGARWMGLMLPRILAPTIDEAFDGLERAAAK